MPFSVCSIVRDEEPLIEGMILSCLPYLDKDDELVIIDGGSRDKTYFIAKWFEGTNRSVRVVKLPQEWKKREWFDEAAYRNLAWSYCKNDWILSLDADEAYSPKTYKEIREFIVRVDEAKAIYYPTINFYGSTKKIIDLESFPDYHIRLADRKAFKWVGKIHPSLWLGGSVPINPLHKSAFVSKNFLYHYARVKGEANRPYGDVPKKIVDFSREHPRREFDV